MTQLDLTELPLPLLLGIGLAIVLVGSEIGRFCGLRAGTRGGENLSTIEAAVLGLLALLIGFTFAMALSRFDARRDAVLIEANAIGTTALRARMLPAPHNTAVLDLLRDYVQVRLDITQRSLRGSELQNAIGRSNQIQERIWLEAELAAAKNKEMVPTGLFIVTLNEMIDAQGKRLAALQNRVPDVVVFALLVVAAIAVGFSGYASGLEARPSRTPVYVMGLLLSVVIVLILDLDRPGSGFIRVSQAPMLDLAESLKTINVTIPPR